MPGQSRSLLQFTQEPTHTIADLNDFVNEVNISLKFFQGDILIKL